MIGLFTGLLAKAAAVIGQERAGHKYIRRVPKKGGKGFDYIYSETGTARAPKEGERVNIREKGLHDVVKVHGGHAWLRDETGKTEMVSFADFHEKMHAAWEMRYERGSRRLALRFLRESGETGRGLVAGKRGSWKDWAPKLREKGIDADAVAGLLAYLGKAKGWGDDPRKVLLRMAGDPLWGKRIMTSGQQVAKGAENLARFGSPNPLADPVVTPEHVVSAARLRFEDPESAKPDEAGQGEAQTGAKPAQTEESDAGMKIERLRLDADRELTGIEAILGAMDGLGGHPGVEVALGKYIAAAQKVDACHELQSAAIAYPGLLDVPELGRWQAVKGRLTAIVKRMGYGESKPDGGLGVRGADTSVYIADEQGRAVPQKARYRLVDAGDLIPSHKPFEGFKEHEKYPKGVQERVYHKDKNEQEKVLGNAQRLAPDLVVNSNPDAANGPPVVTKDGIVLGGNSRVMSLQIVHATNEAKRKEYVDHLRANAATFGFSPNDIAGMRSPVLVREVDVATKDPKALGLLARQYNEAFTQAMDPRTDQVARARRVTDDMIQTLSVGMGDEAGTEPKHATLNAFLSSSDAHPFVDAVQKAGIIDKRNHSAYVRPDGTLNEDGKTFVERLLVGKVLPNPDVLGEIPQGIFSSLSRSVPHILRADATGHDISGHLLAAAKAYTQARTWKKPPRNVSEWESQGELAGIGGRAKLSPEAKGLLRVFFERPGERQMPEYFRDLASHAARNRPGAMDMFGGGKSTARVIDDIHEGRHKALQRHGEEGAMRLAAASSEPDLRKAANAGLGRKLHERFRTFAEKVAWVQKHMPEIDDPDAFVAASLREAGHPPERDRVEKADIRARMPGGGNPGSLGAFERLILWKAMMPTGGGRGGWSPIPMSRHGGWHRRRGDGTWEQWYPEAFSVREQLSLFGPVPRGAISRTPLAPTLSAEAADDGDPASRDDRSRMGEPQPFGPGPHLGAHGRAGGEEGRGASGGPSVASEIAALSDEAVEANLGIGPNPVFTRNGTDPAEAYVPPAEPFWQPHADLLPAKTRILTDAEKGFVFPDGRRGTLFGHQVDNAERYVTAWNRVDGVLDQSDPGGGKTMTALAAARAIGAKRVLVVTPVSGKRNLRGQWTTEARQMGFRPSEDYSTIPHVENGFWITSYDELAAKWTDPETGKRRTISQLAETFQHQFDVIIFDESHNMATAKPRAMAAVRLQAYAEKTAYLSATPFTNVVDMHYLRRLGLFHDGRSFAMWAKTAGCDVDENRKGIGDIPIAVNNPSSPLPMAAIAAVMHVDGLSVKKRANLEGAASKFALVGDIPDEAHRVFRAAEDIAEVAAKAGIEGPLVRANMVSWMKAYWETLKLPEAIRLAEKALREDPRRQLAFFTSYKSFNHGHLRGFARSLRRRADKVERSGQRGGAALAASMRRGALQIEDMILKLPPTTNPVIALTAHFGGPSKVARVHGAIEGDPHGAPPDSKAEQDAYQAGSKRIAVITMDKGGTGFNWHDKVGDAPRVQVNLSLPWSGTKFTQVALRSHRLGSMSPTEIHWIVGDHQNERHNAAIVANRLQLAGSLTEGDYDKELSAAALANFDFGLDVDEEDFQEGLEAAMSAAMDDAEEALEPGDLANVQTAKGKTLMGEQTRDHFRLFAEARMEGRDILAEEAARRAAERKAKAEREARRAMAALEAEHEIKTLALPNGEHAIFGGDASRLHYKRDGIYRLAKKHGASTRLAYDEITFPTPEDFHAFTVELIGAEKIGRHAPLTKEEVEAQRNPVREEVRKVEESGGGGVVESGLARAGLVMRPSSRGEGWVAIGGNTYAHKGTLKDYGGKWDGANVVWNVPAASMPALGLALGGRPKAGAPVSDRPTDVAPDMRTRIETEHRQAVGGVHISPLLASSWGWPGPFATLLKAVQFDMFGQHQKVGGGGVQGRQLDLMGIETHGHGETFQGKKPPGPGWQPIPGTKVGDGWRRPHPGGGWEYRYEPHRHSEYPHGGKGKPGALVRDEEGIIHHVEKVVRRDSEWHFGVKTPGGDRLIPSRQAKIHRTAEDAGGNLFTGAWA